MSSIDGISIGATGNTPLQGPGRSAVPAANDQVSGFKDMLGDYLNQVSQMQGQADKAVRDLATGKLDNVHEVVVAMSEADLSFRLMMQIRNRLVEAYKEIMRMQV